VRALAGFLAGAISQTFARTVDLALGLVCVSIPLLGLPGVDSITLEAAYGLDYRVFLHTLVVVLFVWQLFIRSVVVTEGWFDEQENVDGGMFADFVVSYHRAIYTAVVVGVSSLLVVQLGSLGAPTVALVLGCSAPPLETVLSRRWSLTPLEAVAFAVLLFYVPIFWVVVTVYSVVTHTSGRLSDAWRAVSESITVAADSRDPSARSVLAFTGTWLRDRSRLR
jgi:hypothetical protein